MKTILAALLAAAALAGCSSDYILSTNTGAMIESTSKPNLNALTGVRPPGACGTGGPPTGAAWRCTRAWRRAGGRG